MGGISILLADDSITIQKVVGIIFGSDDYSLTVVDNGKSAIQKAKEIKPDILLIDALMPGMNGYEVCEAIRKDPVLATTPILLLTGSFEPFDEEKARQSGADDHIIKPFESQQIVTKVQELYKTGKNRATVIETVSEPEVVSAPLMQPEENLSTDETFVFDQNAFEPATETVAIEPEPVRLPDDPWGAFTVEPNQAPAVAEQAVIASPVFQGSSQFEPTATNEESSGSLSEAQTENHHIGASWVPDGEQTFEFHDEAPTAPEPTVDNFEENILQNQPDSDFNEVLLESIATPLEPVVEQIAALPPLEMVSDVQEPLTTPVTPEAFMQQQPLALTEEQLKAAILSASKETIERIVWEVVPDLAETMIKEAIKRITEEK